MKCNADEREIPIHQKLYLSSGHECGTVQVPICYARHVCMSIWTECSFSVYNIDISSYIKTADKSFPVLVIGPSILSTTLFTIFATNPFQKSYYQMSLFRGYSSSSCAFNVTLVFSQEQRCKTEFTLPSVIQMRAKSIYRV